MILIIGARSSGKREYVKGLGYSAEEMTDDIHSDKPVIYDVQNSVKNQEEAEQILNILKSKEVVIINEVGSGVIPLSAEERKGREAAGRLGVLLAKDAETVVRVVCGIPSVLKERKQ